MLCKRIKTVVTVALVVITTTCGVVVGQTPIGTAITYQGQLKESGWPAHGTYDFTFTLYDANEGGSQVGDTVYYDELMVNKGLFSVLLDFGSGVFDGDARWVEIEVRPAYLNDPNVYTTLSPRAELTPAPYAIYAATAETVTVEDDPEVGTNTVNFLAKWDGFALVSSSIFDDGTNVGIGLTNPAAKLDVAGSIAVNNTVVINSLGQWIGDPTGLQGPQGDKPAHQWSSTSLRFENPDGSWGAYVDLEGPQGPTGPPVTTYAICKSSHDPEDLCGCGTGVLIHKIDCLSYGDMCTVTSDTGSCSDSYSNLGPNYGSCCLCSPQ